LKGFDLPVEVGLELYAEEETVLPFYTGHISRGLLLRILREANPRISQDLHELDVVKPYSVTPLQFKSKGKSVRRPPLSAANPEKDKQVVS
jgi:CRISPR/Cas system endoribonuclease Cas6 (RAMP superfamily)